MMYKAKSVFAESKGHGMNGTRIFPNNFSRDTKLYIMAQKYTLGD